MLDATNTNLVFLGMQFPNRIRELRERLTWSQKKLADAAGTSQAQIDRLEKGERGLDQSWMTRLSKALGCSPVDLLPPSPGQDSALKVSQTPDDTDTPESSVDLRNIRQYAETEGELPVFGSVQGGFDGAAIDYEFPVERIKMPSILVGVNKACGCYVVNDSMEPRYFQGEIVLVHPGRPIRRGDFVVVELEEHKGMVKRFVRQSDGHVELEQLNPAKSMKIDRKKVVGIHLIVGSFTK